MIPLSHVFCFAAEGSTASGFFDRYILLFTLVAFIIGSVWLGAVAQRRIERKTFLQGFFLGNRGLGAWALAMLSLVLAGLGLAGVRKNS